MTTSTSLPAALLPPDPRLNIRMVQLGDAAGLCTCCWADRTEAQALDMIRRNLRSFENRRGCGVVVTADDAVAILGYGQLTLWSSCAEISDLIVAEAYRSRGIGTAIIQHLVRAAQQIKVDCVEIGVALSNPRALDLYRRLGFKEAYHLHLNLGRGSEPVMYLRLCFGDYPPAASC